MTRTYVRCGAAMVGALLAMSGGTAASALAKSSGGLTRSQVIKLIKQYSKTGPRGATGASGGQGIQGIAGTPAPTYAAGSGLTLSNNTFTVNPFVFQERLGGCTSIYEFITSVAENGTATCDYATVVDSKDTLSSGSVAIGNGVETVLASTGVGATNYFVTAQASLENTASSSNSVYCAIYDGSTQVASGDQTLAGYGLATVSLQTWETSPGGTLRFECYGSASGVQVLTGGATASDATVASLTAIAVSGHSTLS